jgi:Na+-translocating ferredoxin:NAD+ oxidoreductase RnfD subunit
MSASAIGAGRPTLRIGRASYPVLLPSIRDPRLHLAAVIISLHVLGQVAFDFRLSIAQILIAVGTAGMLEVGITLWRQKVIMWPASALLTGNGVAFILRVPGTEHGDWWSTRGWWIFAGTAAVSLLSKYLIVWRGHHIFNPSNFGLVLCFLLLGPELADPLDFWWGPMSPAMALALAIIVAGGLAILLRLRLLSIAIAFWVAFAACLAVLAATGHAMTARWHLGPVTDWEFWLVLAFSPEILVFLFFMITDPKTIPSGRTGRLVYAVSIGLLAALLIAPQTTEFASKVAVLGALAIVCAARPVVEWLVARGLARRRPSRRVLAPAAGVGAGLFVVALVVAGIPARPSAAAPTEEVTATPAVQVEHTKGLAQIDDRTAARIAADLVAELRADAPNVRIASVRIRLAPGEGQEPPTVVAVARGRRFELALANGRYRIVTAPEASEATEVIEPTAPAGDLDGVQLRDVAADVGLDFRHGAFRFGVSSDTGAMMGGGLCWLDADNDGRLDLFAVNSYAQDDYALWQEQGGMPRSALFRNAGRRFVDVSRSSGADLPVRGSGCVAADLDLDGNTDLFVTTAGYNVATDGYDALLWGRGDGTFVEGAAAAGIDEPGWHAGAAVGDVDGDGLPDLFVAGYTDPNAAIPGSAEGFPGDHRGVRDLLYLNQGRDGGRTRFREVGRLVGLEPGPLEHGLGAVITDVNADGRLDLYVANDEDPNRLYVNVPARNELGFRFEERGAREGVADENAGMGVAAADFDGDGRGDLFVSNSRRQLHAIFRGAAPPRLFADVRPLMAAALGTRYTGWGASWADLDHDTDLDLALANGAIPVLDLGRDAQHLQVLENLGPRGFARAGGLGWERRVNGRGVAAADYDNDGDLDLAVGTIGGRVALLESRGARGNWLEVAFRRFSPGAKVTVMLPGGRRLVREVHAGSSYLSSEDPRVHFGLAGAKRVDVVVRRPGGRETRLERVPVNRLVTVP